MKTQKEIEEKMMSEESHSDKLNDLLRDVAEECIKHAKSILKEKGFKEDPIMISVIAYTTCMEWTKTMFTQILGECQELQKKYLEDSAKKISNDTTEKSKDTK